MPKPTTIITTIYNRASLLPTTIESILRQTDPDFTLLLWDDGSTDDSVQVAQRYAKKDHRIRIVQAQHRGAATALRDAIAYATSKYIGCVDSDDLIHPTALAETRYMLDQHLDLGMVYTKHELIDAKGNSLGPGYRCNVPYSRDRLLVSFMTFHFRLIRRTAYDAAGGVDAGLQAAIDYDLCLRLSEVAQIHHIPKILYSYRIHRDSISQQQRQLQIDCAATAVRRALYRRGLANQYELEVREQSIFVLKKIGKF